MDPVAASRELADYCALVHQAQKLATFSRERRATMKAVNQHLPTLNQIIRTIAPDIRPISARWLGEHVSALPRVSHALALIAGWNQMTSHQWTGGGPALPLSVLDPMVANAAEPLWKAEKYRQAVSDAATSVNQFAQNRLCRYDISDKELMAQAFSDRDPEEGKPRLRCPGDHRSLAVRSMQQGALLLSQGCFQAIRNPAHHVTGDWNPVTAGEHLAVLSVVARWVRHWEIERYIEPLPDFSAANAALIEAMRTNAKGRIQPALPPPTGRRGSGNIARI